MSRRETLTEHIPSMRITRDFLTELSELIDRTYSEIPESERRWLTYTVGGKTEEREFDNSAALVRNGIPKGMKELRVDMSTSTKTIRITLLLMDIPRLISVQAMITVGYRVLEVKSMRFLESIRRGMIYSMPIGSVLFRFTLEQV